MRQSGAHVEHVGQAFPFGTEDRVWLSACGQRGWIILTRDKGIRRRRLEIDSIRDHNATAFCLIATDTTADETADLIVPLVQKFVNMSVSEPKPFLYTFGRSGRPYKVKLHK